MNKVIFGTLVFSVFLLFNFIVVAAEDSSFTVIVLPDTQNYLKYPNAEKKFFAQTNWIKENSDKMNIKFVIHEGDITDDNSPEQWKLARDCMAVLDGNVPYAVCVGNHDIHKKGPGKSPICQYFKVADYKEKPWWGGKMPQENCFFYRFEANGQKYLILSLNFGPSDNMLKWADQIIKKNKEHKIFMVTHVYVADDGNLSSKKTKKNASFYGKHANGESRNTGRQVWEKHVRKHKNYLMVFSGHLRGPAARNSMKGKYGNTVHQMLANYQYEKGGGNGFLRILQFYPDKKICKVFTFSPYRNEYLRDEKNEFILHL